MDTSCIINRMIYITWDNLEIIGSRIAKGSTPYPITPCPGYDGAGGGATDGLHDVVFEDDSWDVPYELGAPIGRLVVCNNCARGSFAIMHGTDPEDLSHFGLDPEWMGNFDSGIGPETIYFWRDHRVATPPDPKQYGGVKHFTHDRLPIIENGKAIWPIV